MDQLLTASQVSALIQVNEKTVYRWVRIGYIPHIRLGRKVRFQLDAVKNWISERAYAGRTNRLPKIAPRV